MTSNYPATNYLTSERITLIDKLVRNLSLNVPVPDKLAQMAAANHAALISSRSKIDESELRAIIYDSLFPNPTVCNVI
ncbi:MAG: hypothetical protein WBA44_01515 [Mesorhizobium sp.]